MFLFDDAHFNLRLYGVTHEAKDHLNSERGNHLPPLHALLILDRYFTCTVIQTGYYIPRPFVTPVVRHWMERTVAQWYPPRADALQMSYVPPPLYRITPSPFALIHQVAQPVVSSANGLVGTGFASWYRHQPRTGF